MTNMEKLPIRGNSTKYGEISYQGKTAPNMPNMEKFAIRTSVNDIFHSQPLDVFFLQSREPGNDNFSIIYIKNYYYTLQEQDPKNKNLGITKCVDYLTLDQLLMKAN